MGFWLICLKPVVFGLVRGRVLVGFDILVDCSLWDSVSGVC